jgi:prepilin-type N-terminal cleavage/methylation domain-containing protein
MKRHELPTAVRASRSGFSLIELLVVIVILGILMSLIIPAITRVRRTAQEAAVGAEIAQLDQAITRFKTRFGVEPPSSLTIPTSAAGWSAEDRQKVLRIWDQFDFSTLGGMGSYPSAMIHLNGAECLVFFLGGVNANPTGVPQLVGFSKNPRTPWNSTAQNRDVPFYDRFTPDRFVDVDEDGVVEFIDGLPGQTTPVLYFSSQGKSYRKENVSTVWDEFDVHSNPLDPNASDATQGKRERDMTYIYVGPDGKTPLRPQGYQIISPGFDGWYGSGGVFSDGTELAGNPRGREADNITSFSDGKMGK